MENTALGTLELLFELSRDAVNYKKVLNTDYIDTFMAETGYSKYKISRVLVARAHERIKDDEREFIGKLVDTVFTCYDLKLKDYVEDFRDIVGNAVVNRLNYYYFQYKTGDALEMSGEQIRKRETWGL